MNATSRRTPFQQALPLQVLSLLLLLALSGCAPGRTASRTTGVKTGPPDSPTTALSLPDAEGWMSLFDGETLTGWKITDFAGHGDVKVEKGQLLLGMGVMTGITWTNPAIQMDYELELKAMRTEGGDFFCGLTFPVGEDPCSLIVGGWGGGVVGLSSLDGEDAANNETTKYMNFENGRWYTVRLRVQPTKIQAWIDDEQVVDVLTRDRKIGIRIEVEESKPLGVATWSTASALKDFRVRKLK